MAFRRGDPSPIAVARVVQEVRAELEVMSPEADIRLTGAASVPGTLTGGDIDLHVRVESGTVVRTVAMLAASWTPVHRAMWTDGFATLERTMDGHPVGMAITAADDDHDRRFRAAWSRLTRDPAALAAYESMKAAHDGGEVATYLEAKGRFFEELDRSRTDRHPTGVDASDGEDLAEGLSDAARRSLAAIGVDRPEDAVRWPADALAILDGVDAEALKVIAAAIHAIDANDGWPGPTADPG